MKKTKTGKLTLRIRFRGKQSTSILSLRYSKENLIPRYLKENFGAPFIVGFQVLLLVCAASLIQGNSGLANEVAIYAYYLLAIGVFLQLASFLKHRKEYETGE